MRGEGGWFPKGVLSSPKPIKKGQHLSRATEFKKGRTSEKKLPVGSITVRQRKNRNDAPRAWIKVADPNEWMLVANWVWISNFGPIPKGCVIHHIDEDSLNDSINNLALVTPSGHGKLHADRLEKMRGKIKMKIKDVECANCGMPTKGKKSGWCLCSVCAEESIKRSKRKYKEKKKELQA